MSDDDPRPPQPDGTGTATEHPPPHAERAAGGDPRPRR